jgi:hypothetical protein
MKRMDFMRVNFRWLGLSVIVAGLAASAACGGEIKKELQSVCDTVKCDNSNPYVQCDPTDALCKCGPVELNLICGPDEVCTPQGSDAFACVNTRCELQQCKPGETCNPSSGKCACGTGPDARECDASQTCQNGRCSPGICDGVQCKLGSTCDPDDGACKCAGVKCDDGVVCLDGKACHPELNSCDPTQVPKEFVPECQPGEDCLNGSCKCAGGAACSDDQRCSNGACVSDPCAGVNCPFGTTCNPEDSLCHCGTDLDAKGPVCAAGQACFQGNCVSNSVCEKVTCAPGMVCDPNPEPGQGGFCRCGGIGNSFPRCSQDQTCDLTKQFPACVGGDPCKDNECSKLVPGSSCDPEDGKCKCGGLDGVACGGEGQTGYACTVEDSANACTTVCDPLGKDCTGEKACYYSFEQKIALCQTQGDTLPDHSCKVSNDCVPGSYCVLVNNQDQRVCRELCDLSKLDTNEPTGCPLTKQCGRLQGSTQANLGQCLSVN